MTSFVLTIDVEIDAGRKWKTSDPATYIGVTEGIPRLQALCYRYGVKPTYLISPAVMVDGASVELLGSLDRQCSELGSHLHGEYIPPMARYEGPDFSGCDPGEMQCDYAPSIEYGKLLNLTNMFERLFGYRPRSFRAGRFGARAWTIACLEALGYTHDTSVTPFSQLVRPGRFLQARLARPLSPFDRRHLPAWHVVGDRGAGLDHARARMAAPDPAIRRFRTLPKGDRLVLRACVADGALLHVPQCRVGPRHEPLLQDRGGLFGDARRDRAGFSIPPGPGCPVQDLVRR